MFIQRLLIDLELASFIPISFLVNFEPFPCWFRNIFFVYVQHFPCFFCSLYFPNCAENILWMTMLCNILWVTSLASELEICSGMVSHVTCQWCQGFLARLARMRIHRGLCQLSGGEVSKKQTKDETNKEKRMRSTRRCCWWREWIHSKSIANASQFSEMHGEDISFFPVRT